MKKLLLVRRTKKRLQEYIRTVNYKAYTYAVGKKLEEWVRWRMLKNVQDRAKAYRLMRIQPSDHEKLLIELAAKLEKAQRRAQKLRHQFQEHASNPDKQQQLLKQLNRALQRVKNLQQQIIDEEEYRLDRKLLDELKQQKKELEQKHRRLLELTQRVAAVMTNQPELAVQLFQMLGAEEYDELEELLRQHERAARKPPRKRRR